MVLVTRDVLNKVSERITSFPSKIFRFFFFFFSGIFPQYHQYFICDHFQFLFKVLKLSFLFLLFLKYAPYSMWGLNSQLCDQELHALPMSQPGAPGHFQFRQNIPNSSIRPFTSKFHVQHLNYPRGSAMNIVWVFIFFLICNKSPGGWCLRGKPYLHSS